MVQVSANARVFLDPRLPGGVYVAGQTGRRYRVEAIYRGADAARVLGYPAGAGLGDTGWALAVTDLDEDDELDGQVRIEQTPWDPARDYVLMDPAR